MELRCQLRFIETEQGARATLEASDPGRCAAITLVAEGADRAEAVALLAERTRELYDAVCGLVESVEEVAQSYLGSGEDAGAQAR
ncbi:MAG: hypothetical protein HY321_02795 [Armatimonadetes bacterium]|nr:hypothetical protein [Armatimonadota bacterium]